MKNQYMFFAEQLFAGIDLSEYNKIDRCSNKLTPLNQEKSKL